MANVDDTKLEDEFLYPERIDKESVWTPEADMLLQITQELGTINDTLATLTNAIADISKLLTQAAEAASAYLEKQQ